MGFAMDTNFSWKKFQFITEVQTALINNATNMALDVDAILKRAAFSATGTLSKMDEAFSAAERIPSNMSAHDAACDLVNWLLDGMHDRKKKIPNWLDRK